MPAPEVSADLNVLTVGVQEFLIDSSNSTPNVTDVDGPSTGTAASTFFDAVSADDIDTITIESRLDSDGTLTADQFTFDQQVLLDYATAYNAASTAAGGATVITIQFSFVTVSASEVAIAVAYLENGTLVGGSQYNVTGIGTSSMSFAHTSGAFVDTLNLDPSVSILNTDIADAFLSSVQVTVADDATRDFVITAQNPLGSVDPANPLTLTGTPNNAPDAIDDAFDGGALSTLDENFTDIDIAALITANDLDDEGTITRDNIISVTDVLTVATGAIDPAALSSPATVELLGNQLFLRADGADLDPIQNGNTSDFNYLDQGQSAVITFEYTIDDNEDGVGTNDGTPGVAEAQDTATVSVTITGSNDAVEFVEENDGGLTDGFVDSNGNLVFSDLDGQIVERLDGAANENLGASSTGGSVRFVDLDSDDTHGFSVLAPSLGGIQGPSPFSGQASGGTIGVEGTTNSAPTGYIGSFVTSLESDSNDASTGFVGEVSWTFSVDDSQIDLLSGDQSFTQSYEITIFEEAEAGQTATSFTQTVTILIQGTNDAPVISIEGTDTVGATLVEDVDGAGADASGTISVTDVDVADSVLQSVSLTSITRVPTITNGVLDDVEDPIPGTVDLENDGRPSDDELESMISLVGGANGVVIPSLSSVLQSDTGDATGTSGTITWEFDASGGNSEQVFDYLAQDEEVVITYTVTVTDFDSEDDDAVPGTEPSGTSDNIDINVTVTGTNDAVEIVAGGDTTGDVTEEAETDELGTTEGANAADRSTSGTIEFTDLDFSDNHTASVVQISSSLNSAPTTAPDTNLTDVDGGTDAEVLANTYGTVAIINFVSAQGDPTAAVSTDFPTLGEAQPERVGSLVWEYTVGDAVLEQLGEGETMVEVFEITIKDIDGGDNVTEQGGDATQLITITATGTNDQPVFDATAGGPDGLIDVTFDEADVEDGEQLAVEGITDIDIHDEVTVSLTDVSLAGDGADSGASSGLTVAEATDAFGLLDVDGALRVGNGISSDTLIRDAATTGTIDSEILVDTDDVNSAANVFDSLGEGESVQITYTLQIDDDSGATNNSDDDTITVTVIGDNDDVTIQEAASDLTGSVTEVEEVLGGGEDPQGTLSNTDSEGLGLADDVLTATGAIEFADLDIDDEHTASFVENGTTRTDNNGAPDANFLGTFSVTINAGDEATVDAVGDGRNVGFADWTFTVADEDIEFLREGQSIQQTYTITIEDESVHDGADTTPESAATVDVVVTITGRNDRPVIDATQIAAVNAVLATPIQEADANTGAPVLGSVDVSDIDVSDTVTLDVAVAVGGDGSQQGQDDGITADEVEALMELTNGNGAVLDDTDDTAPATAFPDDDDVVIDGTTDAGTVNFGFNSSSANAFDYLSEGEQLQVTVTATVTDDSSLNGQDTEEVVFTIEGDNDPIVIDAGASALTGAVTEVAESGADDGTGGLSNTAGEANSPTDELLTTSGTIAFSDLDLNDQYSFSVVADSLQMQNDDASAPFTDGDAANGSLSFSITTQGNRLRDATDSTLSDNDFVVTWTYTVPDETYEFLQDGETVTESFTVVIEDDSDHDTPDGGSLSGASTVVTVTITGSNDAPVITLPVLPAPFTVTESDANGGATFPILVEDIDLLDEVTADVTVVTGGDGAGVGVDPFDGGISGDEFEALLSISGGAVDGTTVIDNVSTSEVVNVDFNVSDPFAFDYLSEGEELNVTITGSVTDGLATDSEEIVITIVGENDQAFIIDPPDGGVFDGSVEEVVEFFPVPNANQPVPETTTTLGGIGGGAEGFIAFADFDFDDTHRVDVVDATGFSNIGDVAVQILIPNTGFLVRPDDNPIVGGTLEWVYSVADGDIEFLGVGESITEVFTIELYETSPYTLTEVLADTQDVTITAFGRNDAPEVLGGDFSASLVEGDEDGDGVGTNNNADGSGPGVTDVEPLVATGSINVEDLDVTDIVIVQDLDVAISGTAPDLDDLADGSQPPIFEDGDDVVDINDIRDMLSIGGGTPVGATIVANGDTTGSLDWEFNSGTVDFDFLAQGEELVIDYTITVQDDSGATDAVDGTGAPTNGASDFAVTTVTVTITGTNDAPVIDEASSILGGEIVELEEDDPLEQDDPNGQVVESVRFGTIVYNDVDSSDLHTIQSVAIGNGAAPDGSFVGNFDVDVASQFLDQIEWTLNVLDSEIEHLREGESAVQSYAVVVNDNKGGSDTTVVTVTLTGTNDRPDITVEVGDSDAETLIENSGVEDGPDAGLSTSGTLSVEDIDIHDVVVSSSAILSSESDQVGQPDDTTLDGMFSVVGGLTGDAPNTFTPNSGFAVGETTGTLTWTFNSGAESFDYLADGESLVIEYTVTVQDDSGVAVSDTDSQVVTITINGTNDRPIVTAETNVAATLAEDNETVGVPVDQEQAITASGSFDIEDLDVTNEVTATVSSVVSSGDDNDAQGATPANGALQALLTLGANPVIANGDTTGTVTWDFNAADNVFDYLAVGESIVLDYTITIDDGRSQTDEPSTSEQVVTITVTGTNDRPEVTGTTDAVQTLTENVGPNAGLTANGSFDVLDDDTTEEVTISDVSLATSGLDVDASLTGVDLLAMFSPQSGVAVASGDNTGNVAWTFDSGAFGFDYLDENESITLLYTVTVEDGQGETDTTQVSITIDGTNDAPTIAAATTVTGQVDEPGAAAVNANGVFTVEDLDTSDIVNLNGITVASSGVTTAIADDATLLGLFTVSGDPVVAAGDKQGDMTWDFDLGAQPNVFDYLADGEDAVLTYSVELIDDSGATVVQDVVVTVTGTNDTPTIDVSNDPRGDTRSIDETDEEANENGFALISDADLNDTITVTTELASATHIVDVSGATVGTSIGQPADAVLDAFFDAGESPVDRAGTTTGDITWTFASDIGTPETFDYLDDGEALELVYTIFATDILGASDSVDIFITISGTNDGPEFTGGVNTGAVAELAEADEVAGAQQTASGTLTYTDLDLSDVNTASAVGAASNRGTLLVTVNDDVNASDESIDWAYTVDDSAIDDLAEGQTIVDTFDVTVFDDSGESDVEQVSITITGANDAPVFDIDLVPDAVISETDANAAGAGASTITGVSDVDLIDTVDLTQAAVITSTASTTITEAELLSFITITPTDVIDGTETSDTFVVAYSAPTDRYDFLSSGQELQIVYTLTATDGEGATDTIVSTTTIAGENDAFVLDGGNSDLTGAVTELADGDAGEGTATLSATGSITLTDADIDDTYSAVVQAETNEGDLAITGITLDANGGAVVDWEFTVADADVEDLRAGEEQVETFDILFTETSPVDGDQTSFTQSVTVTITGSNDAPDITVEAGDLDSAAIDEEDAPLSTSGTLSVEDLDVGDTVTVSAALDSVLTNAPAGTPDDAVLEAMFSVDGAPVIDNVSQNGVINWAFDSSSAPENFDYLAVGEVLTINYTVTATDDSPAGATSDVQNVQITIVGTNDAPVIDDGVSVVTGQVTELVDNAPAETVALNEVGGTIVFSDLDLSNTHFTGFTEIGVGAGQNGEFLGSFSIDAIQDTPDNVGNSFQWSLTIQDAELEYLAEGQSISQSYSVFVSDQDDGTDTTTVTVTFTGRNDAPEFVVQTGDVTALEITEQDGTLVEAGTLSVEDIDLIDEVSLSVETASIAGVTADLVQADFDGLLSLTTANPVLTDTETLDTFTYVFNSDGEAYDFLNDGESLVATYTVTATDLEGATALQDITVTIVGTNDSPVIQVILGDGDTNLAELDESDIGLTAAGTMSVQDVDISDVVTVAAALQTVNDTAGGGAPDASVLEGFFSVDSGEVVSNTQTEGKINWAFDSGSEAFDYLAEGEVLELEYLVTAFDGAENDPTTETDTEVVTIMITGTNDAPTIAIGAGDSADAAIDEGDAGLTAGGTLSVEDLDLSDSVTPSASVASVVGSGSAASVSLIASIGSAGFAAMFSVNPDPVVAAGATTGSLAWAFDSGAEAFDELAVGEELTLTYTITVEDTEAATATQDVVITITGTNDAPTLDAGVIGDAVEDDGARTLDLTDLGDDIDSDDDGDSLTYTIVNGPAAGEGSASIDANGVLTFDVGSDFQELAVGETTQVVIDVEADDGNGGTAQNSVTVTVTGVNDDPTLAAGVGAADEDGSAIDVDLAALGDDVDSDDDGSTLTYTIVTGPSAGQGSAAINGTTLTFDPGADFQELAEGETTDVVIDILADDGNGGTATNSVTITVTGQNDAPTLDDGTIAAGEDGPAESLDLSTLADDVDSNDDASSLTYAIVSQPVDGGVVTILGSTVTFDPNGDFEELAVGETTDVTFEVSATDSLGADTVATVTVTVTGVNDDPTLAAGAGAADEDGAVSVVDLAALGDDIDSDDDGTTLVYSIVTGPSAGEGSAVINGTNLEFDPGADFQELAVGETDTVVITVEADDENGGTAQNSVTITVTGVNDDPTLAAGAGAADEDGSAITVDLAVLGDDIDSDDDGTTLTYAIQAGGEPSEGSASITGTTLEFDPGADFQDLSLDETRDVTVTVVATDQHGASAVNTVTITVTGENDAPTMDDASADAVEDGPTVDVALSALGDDVDSEDTGASLNYAITTLPSEGSASINGTTLTFDPGADFQDLAEGETRDVTVGVTATDAQNASSNEGTITFTVTGTNDAPIIGAGTFTATVTELAEGAVGQETQVTAVTNAIDFGDVDLSDGHTVLTNPLGAGFVGTFIGVLDDFSTGDGEGTVDWTFTVSDAELAFLGEGESVVQEYNVSVVDDAPTSLSDTVTVSVTLIGANDAPDAVEIDLGSVAEDAGAATFDLLDPASVSDPDENDDLDTQNVSVTSSDGRSVAFGIDDETGALDIDPSQFQDLGVGDSVTLTVDYEITDGLETITNTATLVIDGANQAPVIASADDSGAVTEDDATLLEATGLITFTDVDLSDGHVLSVEAAATNALGGSLDAVERQAATGGVIGEALWTYTLASADADGLAVGETETEQFTITLDDGNGGTATQDVTVTVTGVNDDPTLDGAALGADEGGAPVDLDLSALGDDVDSDDDGTTLTYAIIGQPTEGSASISGTTLTFDPGTDFVDLADGETRDVTVTIQATDSNGAVSNAAVVTITVTGTDDDCFIATAAAEVFDGGIGFDKVDFSNSDAAIVIALGVSASGGFAEGDTLTSIEGIIGTDFDDEIRGDGEDNSLSGGAGNDTIEAGAGDDFLDGGEGIDTLDYSNAAADASDLGVFVNLALQGTAQSNTEGNDTFVNFENVIGSAFSDFISGDDGVNQLFGEDGGDFLVGGAGDDGLFGGNGFDAIEGGLGADMIFGGTNEDGTPEGDIATYFSATGPLVFDFRTDFTDASNVSSAEVKEDVIGDDIEGFAGASAFSNTVFAGDGINFFLGGAVGDEYNGGEGTDQILGLAGDDTIRGNGGVDGIIGEGGDDLLFGGADGDVFFFDGVNEGDDTIFDFELGGDLIAFTGDAVNALTDLTISTVNVGGDAGTADTLIEYSANGTDSSITVLDVDENDIQASILFF